MLKRLEKGSSLQNNHGKHFLSKPEQNVPALILDSGEGGGRRCSIVGHNNSHTVKMEKYRLVQEHKNEEEDLTETSNCEIRITQQGKPRNYISYAMNIFVRIFLHSWENFPWLGC